MSRPGVPKTGRLPCLEEDVCQKDSHEAQTTFANVCAARNMPQAKLPGIPPFATRGQNGVGTTPRGA